MSGCGQESPHCREAGACPPAPAFAFSCLGPASLTHCHRKLGGLGVRRGLSKGFKVLSESFPSLPQMRPGPQDAPLAKQAWAIAHNFPSRLGLPHSGMQTLGPEVVCRMAPPA